MGDRWRLAHCEALKQRKIWLSFVQQINPPSVAQLQGLKIVDFPGKQQQINNLRSDGVASRLNICVAPQQNNYRLFQQQILGMGLDSLYFGALSTHHLPGMSRFGEVDWTQCAGQRFHRVG